ncbi:MULTISPECIES: CPBP family intramembrane glutamic endopeptidase [Erwinia]|uniref:CPBP family intramembrane glutamic endopeptidase n=1 Tax=Erwinia TaxID=551 RepID=UPI000552F322|nr:MULTISPECIES: CPBP family intramembrane glutamic endopeptidase [Erwinia]
MWYLFAASLLFLPFNLRVSLSLLAVTLAMAIWDHTLQPLAIIALLITGAVAVYCSKARGQSVFSLPGEIVLVVGAITLMLHLVPGFNNQLIVSGVKAGPESAPFTFYYNFDKAMIPFLLLGCMPTLLKRPGVPPANRLWWLVLLMSMPVLLLIATVIGGLDVELHWPAWLGSFALANLFFVSLAEEALFRGYIQQRLSQWIGNVWGLLLAALLFGLAHLSGGVLLVIFASMAGVIYGLAWLWSGRLWVATLAHFAFNMLHLLFFTYPVLQRLPG